MLGEECIAIRGSSWLPKFIIKKITKVVTGVETALVRGRFAIT